MSDFSEVCAASVRKAWDGEGPVQWVPMNLAPPKIERSLGRDFLVIPGKSLEAMARQAFIDLSFKIRPSYARELAVAAYDPATGPADRFAILALLENAMESARGIFPLCQDTGTAAVYGWRGENVLVDTHLSDFQLLTSGALAAWKAGKLRNSQLNPLPGFKDANTGDNSPLTGELFAEKEDGYRFLFIAKGGGSSNKTVLYQETRALLEPEVFKAFASKAIGQLGVSACPPYRIVFVIGGQSPEQTTLAAKLATTGALDALPSKPGANGGPFRDRVLEKTIVELAAASGWGAQFGGRLMARDARVIWLPRHAASLPVVLAVSCSAHRQMYGHIGPDGYFLEHLADGSELASIKAEIQSSFGLTALASSPDGRAIADTPAADSPSLGIPTPDRTTLEVLDSEQLARKDTLSFRRVDIDSLNPANLVCGEFVELWGPIVVARDAAHARLSNLIKAGQTLPEWTSKAVFYAGPTETPDGEIIGSIGPTTSKRMDGYLDELMARGAFVVSLGKGERSSACKDACARYKGAYLVTLGGAAATAARKYVSSVTVLAWPELGMEAVRLINLTGLPAMVAVDSEGRDFYAGLRDSQRL